MSWQFRHTDSHMRSIRIAQMPCLFVIFLLFCHRSFDQRMLRGILFLSPLFHIIFLLTYVFYTDYLITPVPKRKIHTSSRFRSIVFMFYKIDFTIAFSLKYIPKDLPSAFQFCIFAVLSVDSG